MRNKARLRALHLLIRDARYEVLPTANVEAVIVEHLPVGQTVTVTSSPSKGLAATLDLAERLAGQGFHVVPHLAARMISGSAELGEIVDRLRAAGVDNIFVPAGDADPPAGDYAGAVDLLEDLTAMGSPFAQVGVTGYPQPHPTIHDDITVQAMWDKRRHASYIVSNLCFDPVVLRRWVARLRARGVTLPLVIGLPGPVERTKLLAMATKIGVGESTRFLAKHKASFARIASPGGYSPDRFLERISGTLADPAAVVQGLHLFTFNQVAETEAWRRSLLATLDDPPLRQQPSAS
jgi:methylenetetrahydrofolate reductase (NADPH)